MVCLRGEPTGHFLRDRRNVEKNRSKVERKLKFKSLKDIFTKTTYNEVNIMEELKQAIEAIYTGAQSLENARTGAISTKDFDRLNKACKTFFDSFKKAKGDIDKLSESSTDEIKVKDWTSFYKCLMIMEPFMEKNEPIPAYDAKDLYERLTEDFTNYSEVQK